MSSMHLVSFRLNSLLSDTLLLPGRKIRCGRAWIYVWHSQHDHWEWAGASNISHWTVSPAVDHQVPAVFATSLPCVKKSEMQILVANCKTIWWSICGCSKETPSFIISLLFIWIKTMFYFLCMLDQNNAFIIYMVQNYVFLIIFARRNLATLFSDTNRREATFNLNHNKCLEHLHSPPFLPQTPPKAVWGHRRQKSRPAAPQT
jgi:hypothetical protein